MTVDQVKYALDLPMGPELDAFFAEHILGLANNSSSAHSIRSPGQMWKASLHTESMLGPIPNCPQASRDPEVLFRLCDIWIEEKIAQITTRVVRPANRPDRDEYFTEIFNGDGSITLALEYANTEVESLMKGLIKAKYQIDRTQ